MSTTSKPPRSDDVAAIIRVTGVTYRQIDYWTRRGYLKPDVVDPGRGTRRHYPPRELDVAKRIAMRLVLGFTLARAAELARLEVDDAEASS